MDKQWFFVDWETSLGAGGEGEVFLGRCVETWEACAVKVSGCIDPEEAAKQLKAEFERCTRAASPGAVGLIAWNFEPPRPFLVFELARAGTLADEMRKLRKQGSVYHPARALERIREVLVALDHVHQSGLIHRDVKPANLLRFGSSIKLTDFGTGRTLLRPESSHTEAFVGTRMYAAPEQVEGARVDDRADLYAVGCILHEMLTGEVPPSGGAGAGPASRKYSSALVIPVLDRLLTSLLHPDRAQRPADAREALARVDATLASYRSARDVWTQLRLGPSPY